MSTTTRTGATEAQHSYIVNLIDKHVLNAEERQVLESLVGENWHLVDSKTASRTIDTLKDKPIVARDHRKFQIESGMYKVGAAIYKVQVAVHGSGNLYAKRLVGSGDCWGHTTTNGAIGDTEFCDGTCRPESEWNWHFEFEAGAMRRIKPEHRMTLEDAKQFGAIYGVCCQCGATLTDEKSIKAGIGPVCARKF